MRFEDLSWMDVEEYIKRDDRLMLILGACEQHAYLSLLTDIKIPLALADSASQQTGVLIAPPLNFGISPYFLDYPGTISLSVNSMISVVEDMIRCVHRQGFRRVLIINGHGGNTPAKNHLHLVNTDLPDMRMNWYDWWLSHSIEAVAIKHNLKPAHANWLEAYPFTIVGENMPTDAKVPPKVPSAVMDAKTARATYGDGSFGGPYLASERIQHQMFAAALADILQLLKFE
jgi:creatinine amidohydrolase